MLLVGDIARSLIVLRLKQIIETEGKVMSKPAFCFRSESGSCSRYLDLDISRSTRVV